MNWSRCSVLFVVLVSTRLLPATCIVPLYNPNFHQQSLSEEVFEPESEIEDLMKDHSFHSPQSNVGERPGLSLNSYFDKLENRQYNNRPASVYWPLHTRLKEISSHNHDSGARTSQNRNALVSHSSRFTNDVLRAESKPAAAPLSKHTAKPNEQEAHESNGEHHKSDDQNRDLDPVQGQGDVPPVDESSVQIRAGGDVRGSEKAIGESGGPAALVQSEPRLRNGPESVSSIMDVYLLAVIAGCATVAVCGLVVAGICWFRLHKKVKAASSVDYPAYGVTGPTKERNGSSGDRKLAQNAQMYHYQHQKQQMIASERLGGEANGTGGSDAESEEECEEGDYTVFECPGLATAGEMEVRNPLFSDQTPLATPAADADP